MLRLSMMLRLLNLLSKLVFVVDVCWAVNACLCRGRDGRLGEVWVSKVGRKSLAVDLDIPC